MKKFFIILLAVLGLFSLTCCATVSSVSTRDIDESELTNPAYLKKMCQVQQVYGKEGSVVWYLDDRKGNYTATGDGCATCVLVRDGELYGRQTFIGDRGVIVTYNLHDNKCQQITSTSADGEEYYYFEDKILKMYTYLFKDHLLSLAEAFGLDEYITK